MGKLVSEFSRPKYLERRNFWSYKKNQGHATATLRSIVRDLMKEGRCRNILMTPQADWVLQWLEMLLGNSGGWFSGSPAVKSIGRRSSVGSQKRF